MHSRIQTITPLLKLITKALAYHLADNIAAYEQRRKEKP